MSGWTKLFSSIVTSSIWVEDDALLRVWIALLATADAEGIVEGSIPGFANLARVTADQMRAAVLKLASPDPDSRTPDYEGRRIETIEGGWRILNYKTYRERGQAKDGSKAPAMRAYRLRKRHEAVATSGNALPNPATREPEERGERTEASTEQIQRPSACASRDDVAGTEVESSDQAESLDLFWLVLQSRYPPSRVMAGQRVQALFVDQFLNDSRPRAEVWADMQTGLESQLAGHEWRVKGLIPALDRWLEDGRWRQRHDASAPTGASGPQGRRSSTPSGRTGAASPGKYTGVEELAP